MADDYTNTAEHYIPVPAIGDQWQYTREWVNLRERLNKGLAGTAAYCVDADNYVLATTNAGALLSRGGGYPRGSVIGAASGQDPYLTLYTNTGAALVAEWSIGADDSDTDKLMIGTGADLSAPKVTITEAGLVGIGGTAPAAKLDIVGTYGNASGLRVTGSSVIGGMYDGQYDYLAVGTISNDTLILIANDTIICQIKPDKGLWMVNAGAAPATQSGYAGIYADGAAGACELYGIDGAGNTGILTPHDRVRGEAFHRSRNLYTGRQETIWHERVAHVVEECAKALGIVHEPLIEVEWTSQAARRKWGAAEPEPVFFAAHRAEEARGA